MCATTILIALTRINYDSRRYNLARIFARIDSRIRVEFAPLHVITVLDCMRRTPSGGVLFYHTLRIVDLWGV